jgi:uncharacterized protein (DUF2384 family)
MLNGGWGIFNKNSELKVVLVNNQEIYKSLMKLFNSEESALCWLKKPCKPLCNEKPIDLINSQPEMIRDIIYRIATGDMS